MQKTNVTQHRKGQLWASSHLSSVKWANVFPEEKNTWGEKSEVAAVSLHRAQRHCGSVFKTSSRSVFLMFPIRHHGKPHEPL